MTLEARHVSPQSRVASLAEAAAEEPAVRTHACRVCSYFHEWWETREADYFTENMNYERIRRRSFAHHERLDHHCAVKGRELALKHRLNHNHRRHSGASRHLARLLLYSARLSSSGGAAGGKI